MTSKATKTGSELERRVADTYRQMGARRVEHDVELAGNQVDVYVELGTPAGLLHRIAVEAKDWSNSVGIDVVNGFVLIAGLLRGKGLIDEGIIVSASGFSKQARNAAKEHGIRLLEPADLEATASPARAADKNPTPTSSSLLPVLTPGILPQPETPQVIGTNRARLYSKPHRIDGLSTRKTVKPRSVLFRVGRPVQDPADFVGRRDVLQCLSSAMLDLRNISLRGERLTGKTSLLLYLAHPVSSEIIVLPSTHIPVYFNFQELTDASIADVWRSMMYAVAEQVEQRHPESQIDEYPASMETSEWSYSRLVRTFKYFGTSGFKIHLLLDEFDQVARNANLGDAFYDALRSLPTQAGNISYVIATRTGLAALQPSYDKFSSPFFNIFTQITLPPFNEEEVRSLIFDYFARAGLEFSLAERLCSESPFLYDVTGYHPFFLQTLCYHLCTQLDNPDWPLGQAQQKALEAFERDAEPRFEYYWAVSSPKEQELIRKLAAKQPVDWGQHDAWASSLRSLQDRCLVVPSSDAEPQWRLFSSAFRSWVNSTNVPTTPGPT